MGTTLGKKIILSHQTVSITPLDDLISKITCHLSTNHSLQLSLQPEKDREGEEGESGWPNEAIPILVT